MNKNKLLIALLNKHLKELNELEEHLYSCEEGESINKDYYSSARTEVQEEINRTEKRIEELQ